MKKIFSVLLLFLVVLFATNAASTSSDDNGDDENSVTRRVKISLNPFEFLFSKYNLDLHIGLVNHLSIIASAKYTHFSYFDNLEKYSVGGSFRFYTDAAWKHGYFEVGGGYRYLEYMNSYIKSYDKVYERGFGFIKAAFGFEWQWQNGFFCDIGVGSNITPELADAIDKASGGNKSKINKELITHAPYFIFNMGFAF